MILAFFFVKLAAGERARVHLSNATASTHLGHCPNYNRKWTLLIKYFYNSVNAMNCVIRHCKMLCQRSGSKQIACALFQRVHRWWLVRAVWSEIVTSEMMYSNALTFQTSYFQNKSIGMNSDRRWLTWLYATQKMAPPMYCRAIQSVGNVLG